MNNGIFSVYAIVSLSYDRIYVGMSQNVEHRIDEHNSGKVFSTKPFIPWIKFFSLVAGSSVSARKLEKYYKSAAGKRKLRKILDTISQAGIPGRATKINKQSLDKQHYRGFFVR